MLIPNTDYIIVETTKEEFEKKADRNSATYDGTGGFHLTGKVYAVGENKFSESPVMGDGRSFSWARKPDEFPLKNGEEVVCAMWEHATMHEDKFLFVVRKDMVLAAYRPRQEVEASLFDGVAQAEELQLNS